MDIFDACNIRGFFNSSDGEIMNGVHSVLLDAVVVRG